VFDVSLSSDKTDVYWTFNFQER